MQAIYGTASSADPPLDWLHAPEGKSTFLRPQGLGTQPTAEAAVFRRGSAEIQRVELSGKGGEGNGVRGVDRQLHAPSTARPVGESLLLRIDAEQFTELLQEKV
ncbi:MAG: hypothetical protein AAF961_04755 [Planctomycetota bacterium]